MHSGKILNYKSITKSKVSKSKINKTKATIIRNCVLDMRVGTVEAAVTDGSVPNRR